MNPLTNMKNVTKLSEQDLQNTSKSSWHDQYKDSAWIFIGGLPYDLTEGDIICVFSQYGEVVNINLIRDKDTGKSKGFCFLCYEDQRSTILAVDNFNGLKILKRTIRVDHVQDYKIPKEGKKTDEETKKIYAEGCAPTATPMVPKKETLKQDVRETLADQIEGNINLPPRLPIYTNIKSETISDNEGQKKIKKEKKEKKKKDKKKKSKKKSKKSESKFDETDSNESESESEKRHSRTSNEVSDRGKADRDNRLNSKQRDKSRRDNRDRNDKYDDSTYDKNSVGSSKYSSYRSEKYSSSGNCYSSNTDNHKSSLKGSDGARSRDRYENPGSPKRYKRDISPSIPKRWK